MSILSQRDVQAARQELLVQTGASIDMGVARAWLARAVAAYQLAAEQGDLVRFAQAVGFANEATEHAASVSPTYLANVSALASQAQHECLVSLTSTGTVES